MVLNSDTMKLFGAIAIISLTLVTASCVPDPLEVNNIPLVEQKIVVSSQLIPGQSVAVLLTKSVGALEANEDQDFEALIEQIAVTDAEVSISGEQGTTQQLTHIGNGIYGAVGLLLEQGNAYTLKVSSPTMGEVQATTTVQSFQPFASADARLYVTGDDTLARVNYVINDPPGKNFYMVNAQRIRRRNYQERLINPPLTTALISDASRDGEALSDQFTVFLRNTNKGDTLALFLANVSEDYYRFAQIRQDTRFGFIEFISEPINYPTNVKGGLGYFNLYLPDGRLFILE
jgi:hypothetical protein